MSKVRWFDKNTGCEVTVHNDCMADIVGRLTAEGMPRSQAHDAAVLVVPLVLAYNREGLAEVTRNRQN